MFIRTQTNILRYIVESMLHLSAKYLLLVLSVNRIILKNQFQKLHILWFPRKICSFSITIAWQNEITYQSMSNWVTISIWLLTITKMKDILFCLPYTCIIILLKWFKILLAIIHLGMSAITSDNYSPKAKSTT